MSLKSISRRSPGKVNRCLYILNQREDGYHNIQSLFQTIDWADELRFENVPHTESIKLTGMDNFDGDNLILKAARLLQTYNQRLGTHIHIRKHLPMGAGLGGGSSNAACTLLGLNELWALNLPRSELMKLGTTLGADVAFFLSEAPAAWVEGVGDQLTPVKIKGTERIILIYPDCSISTASIFQHPDLPRNHRPVLPFQPADLIDPSTVEGNHCEPLVRKLHPRVDALFNQLEADFPNLFPQLSGTGSTVFIPIEAGAGGLTRANQLIDYVQSNWPTYVVR